MQIFGYTAKQGNIPNTQARVAPLTLVCLCHLDGRRNAQ